MKKSRFLVLAAFLTGAALLSAAKPAAACNPWMCFIVDEDTTCCWTQFCELECWG